MKTRACLRSPLSGAALVVLAVLSSTTPVAAADDFPDGDADMPEGDEDEPIEEPAPAKPAPKPADPPKKPAEPAKKPAEPKAPVDDVDDDILAPADDEELKPRVVPTPEPKPPAPVDDGERAPRRMVVDEDEEVEFARPKRTERRTVRDGDGGRGDGERGSRTPLTVEESKRLDPEEPEPSSYDPLMLGVIAGGAGIGAVVIVGVVVTSLIVTGPLVLNLWQIPGLTPPTETGSITVTPK
jgi:hypothetical protein